jgi:hypothetical protein
VNQSFSKRDTSAGVRPSVQALGCERWKQRRPPDGQHGRRRPAERAWGGSAATLRVSCSSSHAACSTRKSLSVWWFTPTPPHSQR